MSIRNTPAQEGKCEALEMLGPQRNEWQEAGTYWKEKPPGQAIFLFK